MREDVAGASFLAFGSAAPEIVINVIGVLRMHLSEDDKAVQLGVSVRRTYTIVILYELPFAEKPPIFFE